MKQHAVGVALLCAATFSSAEAAIKCDEDYQIVHGQPISTPYCRDGYLAKVAREYGFKATDRQVRDNPSYKAELCRFVESDIRVKTACAEVSTDRDGGR